MLKIQMQVCQWVIGIFINPSPIISRRHRWLHYMTDDTPVDVPPPERKWRIDHIENLSGTKQEYVPYSTTKPKIEAWKPPTKA
jgi:NADH dehydrogenase (ubiquinone) 1 alpha subcomplex subunit 12